MTSPTSSVPRTASATLVKKLERDAKRNWDVFYKKNETRFFKDRHWFDQEFGTLNGCLPTSSAEGSGGGPDDPEIQEDSDLTSTAASFPSGPKPVLLELGCGVGNALYPLLELYPDLTAHCCDFSVRAVDFVRKHPQYDPRRVHAFVWDLTTPDNAGPSLAEHVRADLRHLPAELVGTTSASETTVKDGTSAPEAGQEAIGTPTVVNMIFVLSAISPHLHASVLKRVVSCFDPFVGGVVRFRDYAVGDMAQKRFDTKDASGPTYYEPARLNAQEPYYRRGADGTLAYFFRPEYLASLAAEAGLEGPAPSVQERIVVNRKQESTMIRRFVQAQWKVAARQK